MGSGREHWERVAELEAMGPARDRAALPALVAVVLDEDGKECWHTKTAALRPLVQLGAVESGPAILKALARDRDSDVREAAIEALGALGVTRAVRLLEMIAGGDSEHLAEAARRALARLR